MGTLVRSRLFAPDALPILIIVASSLASLSWLGGRIIFFWDTVVPFRPYTALQFGSYTWGQNFGEGTPQSPYEYGAYFVSFSILHDGLGVSYPITQQIVITGLFVCTGLGMYFLLRTLHPPDGRAVRQVSNTAGALFYMFNFYTVFYLLSNVFLSWWLYALLPISIAVFVLGWDAARVGRPTRWYVLSEVGLFLLMSAGFWEPPYLVYALFLLGIVGLSWTLRERGGAQPGSRLRVLRYTLITFSSVILTGLWWIYGVVFYSTFAINSISGAAGYSPDLAALESEFSQPGSPAFSFLTAVGVYPWRVAAGGSFYDWQNVFFSRPDDFLFLTLAVVLFTLVLLPALERRSARDRRSLIPLYAGLLLLVFFALQGSNPVLHSIAPTLFQRAPRFASLLYATNLQFILFPTVFLVSLLLAEGLESCSRLLARLVPLLRIPRLRTGVAGRLPRRTRPFGRRRVTLAVIVLAVLVVGVLPWYAWAPTAIPTYRPDSTSEIVPGTTSLPSSFYDLGDFINAHAGSSVTLYLPLSYNFNSLSYDGTNFIDTASPSYLSGTPALLGETGSRGLSDQLYGELATFLSSPILPTESLANVFTSLGIKFVVVNTHPGSIGAFPWFNASLILQEFSTQAGLPLVATFEPYLVYQNLEVTGTISGAVGQAFAPSISKPVGATSNLIPDIGVTAGSRTLRQSSTDTAGTVTLDYNYSSPFPTVWWQLNLSQAPVNLSRFAYLLLTFQTTDSNTTIQLRTQSLFAENSVNFGDTLLRPLNPARPIGDWLSQSSPSLYTIVYPLFNQSYTWYSTALSYNKSGPMLNNVTLSLSLGGEPVAGQNYSVRITNLSAAAAVGPDDLYTYLAREAPSYSVTHTLLNSESASQAAEVSEVDSGCRLPEITYSEVNPTSYHALVASAACPFLLVFRQTFSDLWQASISGNPLSQPSHLVGDGFDNLWFVNRTGTFEVELTFLPQALYNFVSAASMASGGLLLLSPVALAFWDRFEGARRVRTAKPEQSPYPARTGRAGAEVPSSQSR